MSIFDQAFNTPSCFSICNEKGVSTNAVVRRILQQEDGHLWTTGCRQKKKEIDDLLSEALNGLSFEERQEQQEILHGVAARIAEEANFIEDLLHELDAHLEDIKKNSVYGIAEHMDPSYVRARKFRVMFLRATRYDARASANRMLAFFEMKHQLFGSKKLVKDITLDDLDDDDIVCLKSGWIQLAGKDMAGRQIILNLPGLRDENVPLRSDLRIRYYIKMIMLESEEAQITGTIPIVYAVGDMKDRSGGSGYSTNATTGHTTPDQVQAMHVCTDEISEHVHHHIVIKLAPVKLRTRWKFHYGSQTECLYQLSTYGIPQTALPLDPTTNQICLHRHLRWVESRFQIERCNRAVSSMLNNPGVDNGVFSVISNCNTNNSNIMGNQQDRPLSRVFTSQDELIINPTENDILVMGGGKSNNMGNQRFRANVKKLSQAYDAGSKEARKGFVDFIIHSVQGPGGRFLKHQSFGGWKELPNDQSRKIVAQAFRNSYRRRK